jgi:hypothetical protein
MAEATSLKLGTACLEMTTFFLMAMFRTWNLRVGWRLEQMENFQELTMEPASSGRDRHGLAFCRVGHCIVADIDRLYVQLVWCRHGAPVVSKLRPCLNVYAG